MDKTEKTWDGFTLYTMSNGTRATLIDMRGNVVHRWELPFSRAWSEAPHIEDPVTDELIHWYRCYLYPNGDLLAVYHSDDHTPYGYGLIKLDKNSQLLWTYANHVHHDVDVGEDGTIYTLAQQLVRQPQAGLEYLHTPYLADSLVVLSPEGLELQTIPLADAFANSPYALLLRLDRKFVHPMNLSTPAVAPSPLPPPPAYQKNDIFHANSVKVLSPSLMAKFPQFQAGQVLLSLRNLDTLAVVDRPTRRIVWAAQGIWRLQHDAVFLDNGHLLLYDNQGSPKQTRILEYDLRTQAIAWAYTSEALVPFGALYRGQNQRLPNGNTLIVDPGARRLFEVTRDKEVVWECFCPSPPTRQRERPRNHVITGARRYRADELTFLRRVARTRP